MIINIATIDFCLMKENKKILAIIPARGGSKKLPGKNIKLMAGKPLIAYTIEAALESRYIDKVIVSTDDEKISEVSKKYRAEVVRRPDYLATDTIKTVGVVLHALEVLKKVNYIPEVVILLQPTSPLRTADDIDRATDIFLENKNDCELVMSVCETNIYWSLKEEGKYLKSVFDHKCLSERNQDLPKTYIMNGATYITTPEIIKKYKAVHSEKIMPYFMPKEKSIDIDDESDFKLAEKLLLNDK